MNGAPIAKKRKNIIGKKYNGLPRSSPARRKLVQITQEAIDIATTSVNETLNAVRKAKRDIEEEKKKEIERFKRDRYDKKEEAEAFYTEAEQTKRELLELKNQLSTRFRKAKVERMRAKQKARLVAVEKESHFKSAVFR